MNLNGQDGTPAIVDKDGRLETSSSTFAEEHEAALLGDAYTMDIDGITSGTDANWLAVIKNTNDKPIIVTRFQLLPNQAKDDQLIEVYVGGTFVYLAEGDPVVPANLQAGVTGGAEGEFYVSDGTADIMTTITAGSIAGRFPMPGRQPYDCKKSSGWVIPKNQCFMLRPTKDTKFYGFISFYYHASCRAARKLSG